MEKFFSLQKEKQKTIIDAALACFGANGYKKASVSDIASAAGISKAMIFHYFGTKKSLYLYLIDYCVVMIMKEMNERFDNTVTDFFDRIKLSTQIKISVMKMHPALPAFVANVYHENDNEVKEDVKAVLAQSEDYQNKVAFDGMDASKFKESINLNLLMKMLTWLADGYTNQLSSETELNFDVLYKDFEECMIMLKNSLYKAEYL